MSDLRIVNKLPQFRKNMLSVFDDALREGSRDILIDAKEKAPYKKGGLRSDSLVKQVGLLKWRVSFYKEYARYQEFGGDDKRTVKNYTTTGTGKHYLKDSGDAMVKKLKSIIKKHNTRIKV